MTASILALSSFSAEVAVAGGVRAAVARDLAAQAHMAEAVLQRALDGVARARRLVNSATLLPRARPVSGGGVGHESFPCICVVRAVHDTGRRQYRCQSYGRIIQQLLRP